MELMILKIELQENRSEVINIIVVFVSLLVISYHYFLVHLSPTSFVYFLCIEGCLTLLMIFQLLIYKKSWGSFRNN
jgi:hypothetical protein